MIDVIIPAYNAHKTIEQTLCSIAYQTISNLVNVYIVNDKSERDYSDFVAFFKNFINVKELKLEKNSGPGVARQYGLEHSKSDFIAFIDADDVFSDCFALANLYNTMNENDADIVIGTFVEETGTDFVSHDEDSIWLHGKMYRRSFLEANDIRFNDTRSNEDNGFNQFALLCHPSVIYLHQKVYIWKKVMTSITRNKDYEYSFTSLEGYAYNMNYALEKSLIHNCDIAKFSDLSFATIVSEYHYYLQYHDKKEFIDKMVALSKKTLELYRMYPLSKEQEIEVFNRQFNYSFNDETREYYLNPIISFDDYIEKLDNLEVSV